MGRLRSKFTANVNFNVITVELVVDIFISHNRNYPKLGGIVKRKKIFIIL